MIIRDIVKRKRREDALQRERDLLQAVMNGARNSHLVYLDRDFNFVRVNETYARTCGYTPEQLIGKNHFALYPNAENEAIFTRVRDTGEAFEVHDKPFEFPDQPERGVTYWDWTLTPVKGTSGRIEGLVLALHDTTRRKQADEKVRQVASELQRREEQLGIFIDHAPAAIAMFDREMRYMAVSQRWLTDYGLLGQDVLGRCHYEVFPEIPESWKEVHRRCLAGAIERREEDPFVRSDGSRQWIRWEIRPWNSATGSIGGIIMFTEDITARKRTEDALRNAITELARSNKDLEQFASISSHDLQEPLRMITAFTGLLRDRYRGRFDGQADEYIDFTVKAAMRMQSLINDLLAYSKVSGKPLALAPTPVQEALDAALLNLKTAIQASDVRITQDPLPTIMADGQQLTQLFQNLIANSIKYRKPDVAPRIHISVERVSGEWRFAVSDNGIGIDPRFFKRIFEIFQRLHTSERYDGTGVGLAICRKIVERHGGRIGVDSLPGQGSTFWFAIPA